MDEGIAERDDRRTRSADNVIAKRRWSASGGMCGSLTYSRYFAQHIAVCMHPVPSCSRAK